MILIEIVGRQEFAINRLLAALNEAADSFKNVGLSVDAEDCERVIEESLSGGNPGEPKACTGAEERGISGATGAGQHPDGNPESTGDSADRRSPDGTARTPSPDESHRHPHEPTEPHPGLAVMRGEFQYWLDFHERSWREGGRGDVTDGLHVIAPVWPSRGVLKAWIAELDKAMRPLTKGEPRGS